MSRYAKITGNIDWGLLLTTYSIVAIGLLSLYSATEVTTMTIFFKQLIWIAIGTGFLFVAFFLDYRVYLRSAWVIYFCVLASLILVLFIGRDISGARRWISLGPVGIQPSELAKITLIIWIGFLGETKKHISEFGFRELIIPAGIILVPTGLILAQPDLGTACMVLFISLIMLLLLGIRKSTVLSLGAIFLSALPFLWLLLKDYQRKRILSFFDPSRDPLGSGYHAIQSKIAVGSGGLYGKGLFQGTQTQLRFLPEHHTDFIYSVVAEEWGFIGSAVVIILYIILITKIISIGLKAKDRFGALLCMGIAAYFTLHAAINIGMTIGVFPVVGVPLPFISYGGSFMVVSLFCIGVVLNVFWRRHIF
ncbi:MAG TPA: rod shape-determining protein RodA [Deltaproteobacteria bacterium]|nr:rod shape-determining protein RodA [Deltaproteobacteria bacterium]